MSKKKNTLQDLDDFLKQQAASLVTPESLTETIEKPLLKETEPEVPKQSEVRKASEELQISGSTLDPMFRKKLYDFIIDSLETQKDSLPEDKMLINTALYLKSGIDWKNAIRQYWRDR
jgi:hypothetical protein